MSTYYEDLKKNNPAKYSDLRIAGNSDEQIRELVRALHAKRADLGSAVPYEL